MGGLCLSHKHWKNNKRTELGFPCGTLVINLTGACLTISVGCGKAPAPKSEAKVATAPVVATKGTTVKSLGKVLVAYYSYSKDHNTKVVAEQEILG